MRKTLTALAVALALPSAALAADSGPKAVQQAAE